MANAGTVEIDFAAETAKFTAELKKVRADLKSLKDDVASISNVLSKFGTALKASIAGTAIVSGFRAIVQATEESEAAVTQLDAALRSASVSVRLSSDQFQAFAKQMQSTTVFTDEAVEGVESILLSFRSLSGQTILSATSAVLDLSTRLGGDLTSAAKLVGRALEDPEKGLTGLSRAGVVFSQSQQAIIKSLVDMGRKSEAQQIILQELEKRFGGAAAAARDTLGGALKGLENAFGDLFEGDKNSFAGATKSVNSLTSALNDPKLKEGFNNLIVSASATLSVTAKLATALTTIGRGIGVFFAPVGSGLSTVQLMERQLQIMEDQLARRKASGFAQEQEIKNEQAYIETFKQRIEIAKQIEAAQQRRIAAQNLEPVSTTVSRLEGPSDEDVLARMKHQEDVLELRQKALTASINSAGAFLESLDRSLGNSEQTLTQIDEQARQLRKQSLANFAQDNIDIAVSEFDRRLKLEQEFTDATIEENRKRQAALGSVLLDRKKLEKETFDAGVGLLQALAVRSKTAARALILINRGVAIAHIIQNTAAAATKALQIYGPTPAGFAAAAAVKALGAVEIGLVAATGAVELSNLNSGNAGGIGGTTLGTPNNPVNVQDNLGTPASRERVIQVQVDGLITEDAVRELMDKVNEMTDRGFVFINSRSNQASVIRNGRP